MSSSASGTSGANPPAGEPPAYVRAHAIDDALAAVAAHARRGVRPVLLCGGTDWMVEREMTRPGVPPAPLPPIVDISSVADLAAVSREVLDDGSVWYDVGAGVTYLALRRHPDLSREVPLLAAMAREVGAIQIQARGTLGGNLATASPAADGVAALAALGATIELASATRGRRTVLIEEFFTGYKKTVMEPDEVIVSVGFAPPGSRWYWRKVGTRLAQAISKVALAATAKVEDGVIRDARFGVASVGPTTAMLPAVRAEMLGRAPRELDGRRLRDALHADITPIDDVRSSGAYRMHVAERLLEQFVAKLQS